MPDSVFIKKKKKKKQTVNPKKTGKPKNKRSLLSRIIKGIVIMIIFIPICGALGIGGMYFYLSGTLPNISSLKDYRPPIITTVYSDDGRKIAEFSKERRIVVPLSKMPKMLINAFIAAEDSRFFKHEGVDFFSIIRAFFRNIETGSIVQGGSTITQQVTKSFFLSPEKTYGRKLRELILAYRIDNRFKKEEILFLYLNQIYLGHGAYGVEAAANSYFGKSVVELNLAECAMLAGLPPAPSRYSPFGYFDKAKERQSYVLTRMIEEGYIKEEQAKEAKDTKLYIRPKLDWEDNKVPYFTEHIRRYIEKKYGVDMLYKDGLDIYTTANIEMEKAGRNALEEGLKALDKRQGFRGPLKQLAPSEIEAFLMKIQAEALNNLPEVGRIVKAVVVESDATNSKVTVKMAGDSEGVIDIEDMRWAKKMSPEMLAQVKASRKILNIGDVVLVKIKEKDEKTNEWKLSLEQPPKVEGALLCIEAGTGHVKVMIGGRDYNQSQFNRAVQSRRQPGSAFKPLIYAAAIDKGYTPSSILIDSPIVYGGGGAQEAWRPKNYDEKFYGPITLREALAKSRNVVTIKILQSIGINYAIDYAQKLGITSPVTPDLTIALGSSGVSLFELVTSYSVFTNLGELKQPILITKIQDREGNIIEEAVEKKEQVIDAPTAYIMTSLLEGVVKYGTGQVVSAIKRPAAGKTGTTNDLHDAWFIGYTPQFITGTWVGFDDLSPLGKGETGGKAAAPIWLNFMQRVLEKEPVMDFQVPEGVVFAKVDAATGLLPVPESQKVIFECFKEGSVPTQYSKKPEAVTDEEDFWKTDME
ncbi:MAG: PBP1A family penicillin-binding protein [Desulfobacterales bacterium]|nr:PBP1A family penicillin-binding protein [Desulfobacterales bacterium]MBF0396967.1 PBP1A family penicillin-binding protein [Desulfobacterales bacterium]